MGKVFDSAKIFILFIFILCGTINTLNDKFQNQQVVKQGQYTKRFYHPYMQNVPVFFAQSLALLIFYIMKRVKKDYYEKRVQEAVLKGKIIKYNKMRICFGGFIDLIAAILNSIALNYVAGSVYQMMRGGTIAATFFFSILSLKMKAQRHQLAGCALAILGLLIVGISNFLYKSSTEADDVLFIVGIGLLVIGFCINGFLLTYEQKLYSKYHIEPLEMIGLQGLFGLACSIVIVVILTFVPCSFGTSSCVYTDESQAFIERPDVFVRQLNQDTGLALSVSFGVISFLAYNIFAQIITKYMTSLTRAVCDVSRTMFIWIIGIIFTVSLGVSDDSFKWEIIGVGPILIQLTGFLLIISGNLIYNKVITAPCLITKEINSEYNEIEGEQKKSLLQKD